MEIAAVRVLGDQLSFILYYRSFARRFKRKPLPGRWAGLQTTEGGRIPRPPTGGCSLARDRSERSAAFLVCTAALQSATTPDCAMMRDDGRFFRGLRKFLLTDRGACAKIRADGAQMCGVPEMC